MKKFFVARFVAAVALVSIVAACKGGDANLGGSELAAAGSCEVNGAGLTGCFANGVNRLILEQDSLGQTLRVRTRPGMIVADGTLKRTSFSEYAGALFQTNYQVNCTVKYNVVYKIQSVDSVAIKITGSDGGCGVSPAVTSTPITIFREQM